MKLPQGRTPLFTLLTFTIISVISCAAFADDRTNLGDIYRKQYLRSDKSTSNVKSQTVISSEVTLAGGTKLNLVFPQKWDLLANSLQNDLKETHTSLSKAFGELPKFSSSVRLMEEDMFYLSTGAPSWTNALYYKGQILIPVPENENFDYENIKRSLKHEFMHAVINAMSDGKCPGWLDEGLAQWVEGSENPALQPALHRYLKKNPPVPLSLLQNGFTKLETKMVPAAYAQSLYATHTLINTYGLDAVGQFLRHLKKDSNKPRVFQAKFSISEQVFESMLGNSLKEWTADIEH